MTLSINEPCLILKPNEICFGAIRYHQGKVIEEHHRHVPSHRLSQDDCYAICQSMIQKAGHWPYDWIIDSRLNNRSGQPKTYPVFKYSPPTQIEPGVIRYTVSQGDEFAWFDRIEMPARFRQP